MIHIVGATWKQWVARLLVLIMVFSGIQMLGGSQVQASDNMSETRILKYADSPADNPVKGFVGFHQFMGGVNFPVSMQYVNMPMSQIVVGEGEYDWSILEKYLNDISDSGCQSVLSFYLDNPGKVDHYTGRILGEEAIPKYLFEKYGVKTKAYKSGGKTGYSPFYDNRAIWDMAQNFVAEFGKKYDGDPRIASIEASIVGIWGEWHTWPFKEYKLEDSDLIELAKSYDRAFDKTQVTIRYPKEGTNKLDVGYSDYSFCYQTIVDGWSQLNRLKEYNATEYWKTNIGGGELMPSFVEEIFETPNWCMKEGESYEECLEALHPSWLLMGSLFKFDNKPGEKDQAIKAARKLGYDFTVTQATFPNDVSSSANSMDVSLKIKNIGIAPFYYDWKIKVGVLDESGKEIKSLKTDYDLTSIPADGKEYTFSGALPNLGLEKGKYSLTLMVENPMPKGKKLRFANEEQRDDGWLVLGNFTVNDKLPQAREKYGLDISSTDFPEVAVASSEPIKVGVRIKNYKTSNYQGSDNPIINSYKDGKLVKQMQTNWDLSKVTMSEEHYFCWLAKGLTAGEYDIKLQLTSDTAEISLGKMKIVN